MIFCRVIHGSTAKGFEKVAGGGDRTGAPKLILLERGRVAVSNPWSSNFCTERERERERE